MEGVRDQLWAEALAIVASARGIEGVRLPRGLRVAQAAQAEEHRDADIEWEDFVIANPPKVQGSPLALFMQTAALAGLPTHASGGGQPADKGASKHGLRNASGQGRGQAATPVVCQGLGGAIKWVVFFSLGIQCFQCCNTTVTPLPLGGLKHIDNLDSYPTSPCPCFTLRHYLGYLYTPRCT